MYVGDNFCRNANQKKKDLLPTVAFFLPMRYSRLISSSRKLQQAAITWLSYFLVIFFFFLLYFSEVGGRVREREKKKDKKKENLDERKTDVTSNICLFFCISFRFLTLQQGGCTRLFNPSTKNGMEKRC